ncbi:MAG: C-GCAxxG-C-C family protein [Desulfovibrionaceae bacterium]
MTEEQQVLIDSIRERAENLYRTRQHLCTDTVLLLFNEVFDGGLSEQQIIGLTSGFAIGMGESGCLCGAVSGAAMALGLLLGEDGAYSRSPAIRKSVNQLHDQFKLAHKSTCCRVLVKPVKDDPARHFDQCARLTGDAAAQAARILITQRPELMERIRSDYLDRRDSAIKGRARRIFNRLFK